MVSDRLPSIPSRGCGAGGAGGGEPGGVPARLRSQLPRPQVFYGIPNLQQRFTRACSCGRRAWKARFDRDLSSLELRRGKRARLRHRRLNLLLELNISIERPAELCRFRSVTVRSARTVSGKRSLRCISAWAAQPVVWEVLWLLPHTLLCT